MNRRTFVTAAAGAGSVLLAGCSGGGGGGGSDGGTDTDGGGGGTDTDGGGGSGIFRLLISDQPAAIEDFESLDVTLSSARVFRAGEDETITPSAITTTVTATPESTATNETATETAEPTDTETTAPGTDDDATGFVEFGLDDVTVDLTEVLGTRAVSVLEGELDEGRYAGIELRVAAAEGVVDGETVDVMVPSDRLRIIKPFEIAADAELSFVFDINVVQKGPNGGYNLLPVIGKSGVAGEDVEVAEIEEADSDDDTTETETSDGTVTAGEDGADGGQANESGA
jgi:hypothetical protein